MFMSETKTADKCPSFSNQIHYHMQHERDSNMDGGRLSWPANKSV